MVTFTAWVVKPHLQTSAGLGGIFSLAHRQKTEGCAIADALKPVPYSTRPCALQASAYSKAQESSFS
jgi:hypothetical protein